MGEGKILITLGQVCECVWRAGGWGGIRGGVSCHLGGWLALWGKQAFRSYLGGFEPTRTFLSPWSQSIPGIFIRIPPFRISGYSEKFYFYLAKLFFLERAK